MPRPSQRTRSRRRVRVRTPGGKLVVHYEHRRPGPARCSICGRPLHGVPRLRPVELNKLARTEKRPERPYGGVICPSCLARLIRESARTAVVSLSK